MKDAIGPAVPGSPSAARCGGYPATGPGRPRVSVVVPTLTDADAGLLEGLRAQSLVPDEIEVVRGVRPNGLARNLGIARTSGELLVLVDDDARPGHPELIANLVAPLLADATIGATGAARLIPPESTRFQRRVAQQVARIEHPVVHTPRETNPEAATRFYCEITTTCCALRRTVFDHVGGFDPELTRGVDTEFFVRVRRAGYRLVLVPNTWVYHPAPATLGSLVRKHFRYGVGHAQEVARDPERARGLERHALLYLLFRSALLVPNVFIPFSYAAPAWSPGFKPLKALASYAAACGYVWGRTRQTQRPAKREDGTAPPRGDR